MVDKLREEGSLPLMLIGDFNAHQAFWHGEDANKLGNELFEYLVDKEVTLMNTAQPTRKDKIID